MRMKLRFRFLSLAIVIGSLFSLNAFAQVEAEMIRQAVEGPALSGSSKAWVTKFYTDRAFQPAFTSRGQLTYAAEQLRNSMITDIPSHGLILADYLTPAIQSYFAAPLLEGAWLRAEIDLAKAFVDASIHMSIGRLDLKSLANSGTPQTKTRFKDVKFERRAFTKWADLQSAVGAEGFQSVWNRIAPQHKIYSNLKSILASLRAVQAAGGFKAISPTSATLRVGSSHAVVAQLKARAKALGYFVTVLDNRFDQELSDIVRDIQKSNLASPTGYLSPGDKSGWEAFGVTSERRINQVELNMEKVRWLPEALEERHIFVNLAIQELTVVDPGLMNPLLKDMPVIVGQPLRKTPSMRDMVTDVVLNPTWTVPTTVFVEDKVPQIREIIATQGLLGVNTYFFDHQFSVKSGDLKETLSPDSIDWINIDPRNTDIYVVQAPSYMNALGVAKIQLGNPWAIYLHDTNQREKFEQAHRALSSGCVRLSRPIDLAEYLLQTTSWDRMRIETHVAKPGDMPLKPTWTKPAPSNRLPIYMMGLTARLGDDGVMRFTRDVYQQNLYILEALQAAGFYKK